ncbi:hypothetical protein [Streptomyces sp. NPDC053367]|uniref:hypothetical protein n=1 Tax=Streptomyces sp. NPDC053367 TaxID=3365700 RepID=UPI0037D1EB2F
MEINDTPPAVTQQVSIRTDGAKAALRIDGIDYSRLISGYTIHQRAGQTADLIIQFAHGKTSPDFDGHARVAVGVPYAPGPAAAQFLSAIDAALLEKAVLARHDLMDGGPHELTRATLVQLREWAQGQWASAPAGEEG